MQAGVGQTSPTGEPVAEVEDALDQVHALECAVRAQRLSLLVRYAETKAWRADGARDLAEWIAARFAMAPYPARELARVTEAVAHLPAILEAFARAELSWDQLRALTRYATPETDANLAAQAAGMSLPTIEAKARRARRMSTAQAREDQRDDSLSIWRRDNRVRIRGDLSPEIGAVIEKALRRQVERLSAEREAERLPYDRRLALALHEICGGVTATDADPDRATVVLTTERSVLEGDDLVADLEGMLVCSETARRLSCDCRLQEVFEFGGIPIGVGRTTRTVPRWLHRLLRKRDRGCRFPGCSRMRWVHAHHILHWAQGGPTDLGNLVLLCSFHHGFLHEGEWRIRGNPEGEIEFVRPDGTVHGQGPPPLRPDVGAWLAGTAA